MSDFRDFIPAHEDPGALGNGFTDFVPTPEPKAIETPKTPVEETPVEPVVEPEPTVEAPVEPEAPVESVETPVTKGKGSK